MERIKQNKERAIEIAIGSIEKQFGRGSIMCLGDEVEIPEIEVISTGSLGLDLALGVGGLPRGRTVEIFGPEGSGKTTLALHVIAEAQRLGGMAAAFIYVEHALDINYAKRLGVRVERLLISQPDYGEQALEIVDTLVRSGAVDVIVLDSFAALVPKAEIEGDMGGAHMGLQARLMSQALRKITATVSKSKSILIFVNQTRMKIGGYGNPETTTGGTALKFYASVRIDLRRIGAVKDGPEVSGNRVKVKVVKNKVAPPFREAEFDIMFGNGISKDGELIDLGVGLRIIEKSGVWYSYRGKRLGQGRESAKAFLKDHPEVSNEVREKILSYHGQIINREVIEQLSFSDGSTIIMEGEF